MAYEFLEHTADVKFRADGSTVEECFSSAADALAETVRGEIDISEVEEKSFEVEGGDREGLLYSFLEEFLFLLDAEDFLVAKIKSIKIEDLRDGALSDSDKSRPKADEAGSHPESGDSLSRVSNKSESVSEDEIIQLTHKPEVVRGEAKELGFKLKCVVVGDRVENYKFTNDVKAVTYSDMFVKKDGNKWVCQVVLDI